MDFIKLILTAVLSILTMFLIEKLMGRKSISQMTLFDYTTGITIGSIAAELATELEEPWKPFCAMIIYGLISVGVSIFTDKSIVARRIFSGAPTVMLKDGVIFKRSLKKAKIDLNDFLMMCRTGGYFDLTQLKVVIMEHNGKLSFLPYPENRPATPSDLSLSPESEAVPFEVIIDGKIMQNTLKKSGHNEAWLMKELSEQGFKTPSEVFLGVCDDKNNLTLFKGE